MEHEIGAFLRSRRGRLHPVDVGLPALGRRRVPGLRREELAQLAGVSVDYYMRLEQGRGGNVSAGVLDAVARALRLSEAERGHLHLLAGPRTPAVGELPQRASGSTARLLELIDGVPAYVLGRRTEVLAYNRLADVLFGFSGLGRRYRNVARFVFRHPGAPDIFPRLADVAAATVAFLVLDSGRHRGDPLLHELVGELATSSSVFRELWAGHDLLERDRCASQVHHPAVGVLEFENQSLLLPDDPDQQLVCLTPEPASHDRLRVLADAAPRRFVESSGLAQA